MGLGHANLRPTRCACSTRHALALQRVALRKFIPILLYGDKIASSQTLDTVHGNAPAVPTSGSTGCANEHANVDLAVKAVEAAANAATLALDSAHRTVEAASAAHKAAHALASTSFTFKKESENSTFADTVHTLEMSLFATRLERFTRRMQDEAEYGKVRLETSVDDAGLVTISQQVTSQMLPIFVELTQLPRGSRLLDVGCGAGYALQGFKDAGMVPVGLTLASGDIGKLRGLGFDVTHAPVESAGLHFRPGSFEGIWARHVLEHTLAPVFVISELVELLRLGGAFYIEVPAPDTVARHQENPNHLSVFGRSMWAELLRRAGIRMLETMELEVPLPIGTDKYYAFIGVKVITV